MIMYLIIRGLILISFVLLFINIYRRYQSYAERPLLVMLFLSVVGIFNVILEILVLGDITEHVQDLLLFLFNYGNFRLIFIYSMLAYMEFHHHSRLTRLTEVFAAASILISTTSVLVLLQVMNYGYEIQFTPWIWVPFIGPSIGLGLMYAFIRILSYWYPSYKNAVNDMQKRQLLLFICGIILWFMIPNLFLPVVAIIPQYNQAFTHNIVNYIIPSIMLVGIVLVIFSFEISKQVIIPGIRKVDNLMVIDRAGLPIYSFKATKISHTEDALLSGGISAISSLLQESIGVRSNVRLIKFDEKDIVIYSQNDLGFLLITDDTTSYLEYAISRFAQNFIDQFGFEFNAAVPAINEVLPLVFDAFGVNDLVNLVEA